LIPHALGKNIAFIVKNSSYLIKNVEKEADKNSSGGKANFF
jgi:hypothetical protein